VLELGKPPGHSFRFLRHLSVRLRDLSPAVVHTRNWGGLDGIVAARLAGIGTVVHGEHGWTMEDVDGGNRKRRIARRWLTRAVREITCVSAQMERWLRDDVRVRRPVTQIYNGVDTDRFAPVRDREAIRRELSIAPGALVVTTCSRLDPIKDHASLFRAFGVLRETRSDARLLVIGDGPERERLERLAGPGVELLGELGDVARVLAGSDIFVLPSFNEGISNTILEAMATGLPVIATAVGGNPELVMEGATGFLVPTARPDSIAGCLERYAADPGLRRAHGEAARRSACERFSVRAMVQGYESVYRRVAASDRSRPDRNRAVR
jgi:sugar transferase (PEP-CTERM/EpsH1 system associated)